MIYGSARVHYSDARRGVDTATILHAIVPIGEGAAPVVWDKAEDVPHAPADLVADAPASIRFRELPAPARIAGNYGNWADDFRQWILRARPLALFEAPAFTLTSRPGESRAEFAARVQQTARERRDAAVDKLRTRYAPKVARAADTLRRAQEALNREEQQVSHQKMQTAVSFGATLLGALMGRKAVSTTTLGRATTAARGVGRSMKEAQDVAQARERQEQAERDLREIQDELEREVQSLQDAAPEIGIDTIEVKAKRTGVDVQLVALVWRGVSE